MTYENILVEKKNSIAYVTVNRPKVLNALNMATMEELRAAFHDIKKDVGDSSRYFHRVGREGIHCWCRHRRTVEARRRVRQGVHASRDSRSSI